MNHEDHEDHEETSRLLVFVHFVSFVVKSSVCARSQYNRTQIYADF